LPAPAYTNVDRVLARLRLPVSDPDAAYIAECAEAANERIHQWLGRTDPLDPLWPPLLEPFPATVTKAATEMAVREYRGKDGSSDVAETWGDNFPVQRPRDPLLAAAATLAAYRNPREWSPA
jgi:hypothetical protein